LVVGPRPTTNSKFSIKKDKIAFKQNKDYKIKKSKIITQSLKSVGQKRNYSTNNTTYSKLNNISFEEFAYWFSGFCDAESNFIILDLGHRFSLYLNIKLHLDDIKVLHYIKKQKTNKNLK
jgi:hypothetical protein